MRRSNEQVLFLPVGNRQSFASADAIKGSPSIWRQLDSTPSILLFSALVADFISSAPRYEAVLRSCSCRQAAACSKVYSPNYGSFCVDVNLATEFRNKIACFPIPKTSTTLTLPPRCSLPCVGRSPTSRVKCKPGDKNLLWYRTHTCAMGSTCYLMGE
jgi:hypothetical protein